MPEEEKIDDFVSLWKKKKSEQKQPSVIGDTIDRINEVEKEAEALRKENKELKEKIRTNIDLLEKSEEAIDQGIKERERLNQEIDKLQEKYKSQIDELNGEINDLNSRIKLQEEMLRDKDIEITDQTEKIETLEAQIEERSKTDEGDITQQLTENLQSELSKKKVIIQELQNKIETLEAENQELLEKNETFSEASQQVSRMENSEKSSSTLESQGSSGPLEVLCQDLQSELNKYKRIAKKLKDENSNLKNQLGGEVTVNSAEDLSKLKDENEALKNKIESLKKEKQTPEIGATDEESKKIIADLEEKLAEKEAQIDQLQNQGTASGSPSASGPMSDLIEDLQSKINKLKIALKEKNKIIKELENK